MEFNSSIDGMRHAQNKLDFASKNIQEKTLSKDSSDISKDILEQKEAKFSFQANARVAKVQDSMLGELIDIMG